MLKKYKTVYEGGEGEIVIKKSRFIATVRPVKSEEEALAFISEMKKKYWDASHNCPAYVLGEQFQVQRMSDDGEPGGTAGKPMLDVLLGEEIHDAAVVVTRYFGGTLLGTGGLVRAYSKAVQEGLANSIVITKYQGARMQLAMDYTALGKIQYILGQRKIAVLNTVYEDTVRMEILVPEDEIGIVSAEIVEGTNGQVTPEVLERCYFADVAGQLKVWEIEENVEKGK